VELAQATGCHAPSLYRLLRALARIGVFVELDGQCFANNALSQVTAHRCLRIGVGDSRDDCRVDAWCIG
jgi:hypothetical protein